MYCQIYIYIYIYSGNEKQRQATKQHLSFLLSNIMSTIIPSLPILPGAAQGRTEGEGRYPVPLFYSNMSSLSMGAVLQDRPAPGDWNQLSLVWGNQSLFR